MKIFIAADIEGCTGVVHADQCMPGGPDYHRGQALMTADINAAIRGALSVCPEAEFLVGDGHASMRNVILEDLHPAADLVIGAAGRQNKPLCQCEGIDADFDLAFLVGFHSKAGTPAGLLAHTLAGAHVYRFTINGMEVGEAAIAEAICGDFGVPIGLVVGNHEMAPELEDTLLPGFGFVSTKRSLGPTAAICRHPTRTAADIHAQAAAVVERHRCTPLQQRRFDGEVVMQVEVYRQEFAEKASLAQDVVRVENRTLSATNRSAALCFSQLWSALTIGMEETPAWLQ